METKSALAALAALSQESRLAVFRLLVARGPEGLAASKIAEELAIPSSSLSFHLKELSHAELIVARQDGRFIIYSANFEVMNGLIGFLTESCCGGQSCTPAPASKKARAKVETIPLKPSSLKSRKSA